jgi:alpha-tubulin suppressor-like RCC1 family protein
MGILFNKNARRVFFHGEAMKVPMLRKSLFLLLPMLFPLFAAEVAINLTGTITDKVTDKPIPNATVRLAVAKATATTDTSGMYTLAGSFAGVREKYTRGSVAMAPSVQHGAILFSVTNGMRRVVAELFDLQGRLVERLMDKPCGPGSYRLTPAGRIAGQALCLRLAIGGQTTVLRFVAGGGSGGFEQVSSNNSAHMAKSLETSDTLISSAQGYLIERTAIDGYSGTLNVALTKLPAAMVKNVFIFNIQPADSVGAAIAQITSPALDTLRDSLDWQASDKAFAGRVSFPSVNDATLRVLVYGKSGHLATVITASLTNDTTGITVTLPFSAFTALRDTFVQIDSPLVLTPDFTSMQYSGKYYWDTGNDGWDDSTATPRWTIKRHAYGPVKVTVGVRLENGVIAGATAKVICWMPVKAVAASGYHTVVIKQDNSLWVWGLNGNGELGDGTTTDRLTPELIMTGVQSVVAGMGHTLILKQDNSLWACGSNIFGLPVDGIYSTPVLIMTGVQSVAEGYEHTLILKQDNSLWACGRNDFGTLGDGTNTSRSTPVLIMTGVQSVAAGGLHTMILKQDSLWACGFNRYGTLGDGTTTDRLTPVLIMTGVQSVAAEGYHTMVLKQDNSLWAWGLNYYSVLGDGTTTDRSTPVLIMTGVQSVAMGVFHTMILKQDSSLWACGSNETGRLGDGTTSKRSTPVLIMTGVQSVAASNGYTMILKQDNSLWACGWNGGGQLGDGTTTNRLTPVQIVF